MIDLGQYNQTTQQAANFKSAWLSDYAVIDSRTGGQVIQKDLTYTQAVKLCNTEDFYRVIKNGQITAALHATRNPDPQP